jgi:endonuclease/exonuclease/phosphatase family metal-dependent hydrolase
MIPAMRALSAACLVALFAGLHAIGCIRPVRVAETPDAPTRSLRVLVFNIHAGKDANRQPNLDEAARLVRERDVDVALIQEVDRGTKRSGGVDQVAYLAEKSGHAAIMGRSLDYDGGEYGVAALSRDGFVSRHTHPLAVTPPQERAGGAHEPRVALVAVARTRLGELQIANTHLDASRDDHYRLQEAAQLLAIVQPLRDGPRPMVIGGDFNAEPESAVLDRLRAAGLRDAWAECGDGPGYTFPSHAPVKRIDYLFLTGSLTCARAEVIETTMSDHRPLLVTVTW